MKKPELIEYGKLLSEIKRRIREGQQRAAISVNATLILTYWEIGQMIALRQEAEGWGASVIPRLAADLKSELPAEKGFSPRNLGDMVRFFKEYGDPPILQQAAAKLNSSEIAERRVSVSAHSIPCKPEASFSVNNPSPKPKSPGDVTFSRRRKPSLVNSLPRSDGGER